MIRIVTSTSGAARLTAATRFLAGRSPSTPVFIVAASRSAADDFARELAIQSGATFGLHRFSLTQLAARVGAVRLASSGESPATALGLEAVAARALFDASGEQALT